MITKAQAIELLGLLQAHTDAVISHVEYLASVPPGEFVAANMYIRRERAWAEVTRFIDSLTERADTGEPERCACCAEPATETPYSPYMNAYCDECTTYRCDISLHEHAPAAPSERQDGEI